MTDHEQETYTVYYVDATSLAPSSSLEASAHFIRISSRD